ncbi:MAG TPA: helix-turn-helix transcriptional regulator [Mycobacterium sp.]|nr:helix-turn-helix transcriptional regulator [Mycobacterium sp.]
MLLDTTDLGEAEEVLSAAYTKQRYNAPSRGATRTRVLRSQIGSLIADEIKFSCDLEIEVDPMAEIALCRIRSGVTAQRFPDGHVEACGPHEVTAVGAYADTPFIGSVFKAHYDALAIDRRLLSQIAAGPQKGSDTESVQLTSSLAISPAANSHMVKAVDYVCQSVLTDPHAAQTPLIAGAAGRYLAATMLATFPNTAVLEPTIEDRHDTTPVLLRRAVAYIDDNAHKDISLTNIARHVYVSPRALQLMFRKHRDCTPTEYLRRVRLHHAHLDLVRENRLTSTVGQIAYRWGFNHVGRFSVFYRQQYGQSPHDTLRT